MSPIGPYFQLNSPNNFSANRSVVFKSLYVIVLRLGKTFEDHVFQNNQLGSRVHIWTPERLEQWYGDRRDFLALLLSHATRARHALASLSPLFAWNTQKITPVLQARISKLLRGVVCTWRERELWYWLRKWLEVLLLRFWVFREINSRFCIKTQGQMFLRVSGRHVGAHLDGHQHGVAIQISINLWKSFLRISSIRKNAVTWILAKVFAYLSSFFSQILDLIYSMVLIFYFDLLYLVFKDDAGTRGLGRESGRSTSRPW